MKKSSSVAYIFLAVEFACICSLVCLLYSYLDTIVATMAILVAILAVVMQREATEAKWIDYVNENEEE